MLTADILAQNGDFPAQAFVFLAQLVHLQLGLGRILQIFGQLAADMVCILFAFLVHIRIVEGGEEIGVVERHARAGIHDRLDLVFDGIGQTFDILHRLGGRNNIS